MIEMLGVLAIIGVLSAGGIMGYSVAMENYKTNKLIEGIQKIVAGSLHFKLNAGEIIRIPALKQLGIIPTGFADELYASGPTMYFKTPFGKWADLYVLRPSQNLEMKLCFWTMALNIPFSTCVKMVTMNWGEKAWTSFYRSGSSVFYFLPMSMQKAEEECKKYRLSGAEFTFGVSFASAKGK